MPTGYTAAVQDGTIKEFSDFAKRCARNFGALVHMRDEPMTAPFPTEMRPSTYHADRIVELEKSKEALLALTAEQLEEARNSAEKERQDAREAYVAGVALYKQRYEDMLSKVNAWTPPTEDHADLKSFMLEQLEMSISSDTRVYDLHNAPLPEPARWRMEELLEIDHDLNYRKKQQLKDADRTKKATEWIQSFLKSLPE